MFLFKPSTPPIGTEEFIENGKKLLEELIRSCNGRCNPIRNFSLEELTQATNNFASARLFKETDNYKWFKGKIEDRIISIKVAVKEPHWTLHPLQPDLTIRDIVIAAQLSGHKNVLKLIGCCLETHVPIAVYEFAENGTLSSYIGFERISGRTPASHEREWRRPLPWRIRLTIGTEIASAVAYLHTAFRILHAQLNSSNVFLDRNCVAKLSEFSFSVSIPDEKEVIYAHGATSYNGNNRIVMLQAEVFRFGMLLMELLTGKKEDVLNYLYGNMSMFLRFNEMDQILDSEILEVRRRLDLKEQVEAVSGLAMSCIEPAIDPFLAAEKMVRLEKLKKLAFKQIECTRVQWEAEKIRTMLDTARQLKQIAKACP